MRDDYLKRRFKDEAVAVYSIEGERSIPGFHRYITSTRDTRDLMNYPEIINCDFTNLMQNGVTNTLKGINILENLSQISSKTVNVCHILRGGLNFKVREALRKGFGYKWHSSSYISSQRVLKEGEYAITEDHYRKFRIPDDATLYMADIVASGSSLDHAIDFIYLFLVKHNLTLRNLVFLTIGCKEAENLLMRWHDRFKETFPGYERTIVVYLEGRFALADENTPLHTVNYLTDLLKNYKLGALLSPEFEQSQFDRMIIGLEGCVIYDGGKKGFEPENHIRDVLEFWEKQRELAIHCGITLWQEYNARFPLDHYLKHGTEKPMAGTAQLLFQNKSPLWEGVPLPECIKLFSKFRRLWSDNRLTSSLEKGSLTRVCEKKIRYLQSLLEELGSKKN